MRHKPRTETELHLMLADYFRVAIPPEHGFFWHTPNQGKRGRTTGVMFKAMGMKPGMTDLTFVAHPRGGAQRVAFLELKSPRERDPRKALTTEQEQFGVDCVGAGIDWHVSNDFDDAVDFVARFYIVRGVKLRAVPQ